MEDNHHDIEIHTRIEGHYSLEFRNLLRSMLCHDAQKRCTVQQMLDCPLVLQRVQQLYTMNMGLLLEQNA